MLCEKSESGITCRKHHSLKARLSFHQTPVTEPLQAIAINRKILKPN